MLALDTPGHRMLGQRVATRWMRAFVAAAALTHVLERRVVVAVRAQRETLRVTKKIRLAF